jgi:hypothetical protein
MRSAPGGPSGQKPCARARGLRQRPHKTPTVPIDVLAERLSTTRGALYMTLHDARKKLRPRRDRIAAL